MGSKKDNEHGVDDLHRVIGQLTVERDFFSTKARLLSLEERKHMIEPHDKLSITQQCQLLGLPRSTYYYQPQPFNDEETGFITSDG